MRTPVASFFETKHRPRKNDCEKVSTIPNGTRERAKEREKSEREREKREREKETDRERDNTSNSLRRFMSSCFF